MTEHTDFLSPLLELEGRIMRALDCHDSVLDCAPRDLDENRSLLRNWYDPVSWGIRTYDDDRDAFVERLHMSWRPVGQMSPRFQGNQPLSLSQVKSINCSINDLGLELIASIVSRQEPKVELYFSPPGYTGADKYIGDNYLGPILVWRQDHQWMRFPRLDECTGLNASFTIAYRFTDDRNEEWTKRFNQLKSRHRSVIDYAKCLMAGAFSDLIRRLNIDPDQTVIIPCLASSETSASPTGTVSSIARHCADQSGIRFIDCAVTKRAHVPISSLKSADERKLTIANANYSAAQIDACHVIIFDDFITRGDTLSAVASAIRQTNGVDSVYGVAFGKNESADYMERNYDLKISNDHVPTDWLMQWPNS